MLKTKVYVREWFFNAGIIGFLKILEQANKINQVRIEENFIEFDTDILQNFDKNYFSYFFNQYNIAEKVKNRIQISSMFITKELQKEKISKEVLKAEKKYLKDTIKTQMDKIKKIDLAVYEEINCQTEAFT